MVIEPFVPSTAGDAEWADCFALHCAAHLEQGTEPPSLGVYRDNQLSALAAQGRRSWVARESGRVVGAAYVRREADRCGAFAIYVSPGYRRRGAARALAAVATEAAAAQGFDSLMSGATSELSCELCVRLGGRLERRGIHQTLQLAEADAAQLEHLSARGARRSPGVHILEFEQLPDELASGYVALHQGLWADAAGGPPLAAVQMTLELRRVTERAMLKSGNRWITLLARDEGGSLLALTEAQYDREQPSLLRQQLTGVLPEHRGRGLAQWLKAELLMRVRPRFQDLACVTTHNFEQNAPMLAINRRLGFRATTVQSAFIFQTDQLRVRLK